MARGKALSSKTSSSNNGYRRELQMYMAHRMWKNHTSIFLGIVGLVITFFAYTSWNVFVSKQFQYIDIEASSPERLQEIFQSGKPWMFYCTKPDRTLPDLIVKVSPRLLAAQVQVGILDCNQRFPSQKNVYQRFKLNKKIKPTIFTLANGEKAKQVYLNDLKDAKSLNYRVIQWTKKDTKEIKSQAGLNRFCLKRKLCVILFNSSKISSTIPQMKQLMDSNRKVAFTWMNYLQHNINWDLQIPDEASAVVLMRNDKEEPLGLVIPSEGEFDGDLSLYGKVQQVLTRLSEDRYEGFIPIKSKITLKTIQMKEKSNYSKTNRKHYEETLEKEEPNHVWNDAPESINEEEIELEDG